MNSPEPSVFIAHPLSTAKDLPHTERLVQLFREAFVSQGWKVRPSRGEAVDTLNDRVRSGGGVSLVTSNIEGIVASDLLLVIVTEMDEPSSVWVEAGVALARSIPLVVVATTAVALPFLIRAAVAPAAATASRPSGSLLRTCSIHTLAAEGRQAQAVGDLVKSIIGNHY
jgi:nucleoside 2-deoxyribosyltransferase